MSYRGKVNYDRSNRSNYRGRVRDNYRYDNRQRTIDKMIDVVITDKTMEGTITGLTIDKIMEEIIIGNRDTGLEVKVGIILEITTQINQGKN